MSKGVFKEDDYLASSNYQNKTKSPLNADFTAFSHEGQSYFALLDASNNVVLRSEGYGTEAARNKGIESVMKNKTDESKWYVDEKMGYSFLVLKAGNHQEIGRSGSFKHKLDAEAALGAYLRSGMLNEEVASQTRVATNNIVGPTVVRENKDILKTEDKEDDYLACKEYQGHPINDKVNNVAMFKHENGQYYFALYNSDGTVKLRSEGFETAKNRDQELSGVLKYHNDDSMYTKQTQGKYSMLVLKDKNGTEVGRSCLIKEEAVATAVVSNEVQEAKSRVVSSKVVSTTRVQATEDDYMTCKDYEGHPVTDKDNNIALFTGDDDQLYFVVYNADGSVRLRSEGFKTDVGRDNELQAAIKHMDDPSMYTVLKKGRYSIKVLKDSIGREVARSCMYTDA